MHRAFLIFSVKTQNQSEDIQKGNSLYIFITRRDNFFLLKAFLNHPSAHNLGWRTDKQARWFSPLQVPYYILTGGWGHLLVNNLTSTSCQSKHFKSNHASKGIALSKGWGWADCLRLQRNKNLQVPLISNACKLIFQQGAVFSWPTPDMFAGHGLQKMASKAK